jgi:hypothetical protein
MRTLTKILLTTALALGVSTAASANVQLTLTQVGGTYDGVNAQNGDTLVLQIGFTITASSPAIFLIDPLIDLDGTGTMTGFTETKNANWVASTSSYWVGFNTIVDGDVKVSGGGIDGFDRTTGLNTSGVYNGCFSASTEANGFKCESMGTLTLELTGLAGVIDTGSILSPAPFGTTTKEGDGLGGVFNTQLNGTTSFGVFTINVIPEPTTASLLGLGLLGLSIAGRNRKN